MKKFQSNVNRELSRSYPDRRRLETQCLSVIGFVKAENDILECPIWVMIVNVVAMDMLKSKLPPGIIILFFYNLFNFFIILVLNSQFNVQLTLRIVQKFQYRMKIHTVKLVIVQVALAVLD